MTRSNAAKKPSTAKHYAPRRSRFDHELNRTSKHIAEYPWLVTAYGEDGKPVQVTLYAPAWDAAKDRAEKLCVDLDITYSSILGGGHAFDEATKDTSKLAADWQRCGLPLMQLGFAMALDAQDHNAVRVAA